MGRDQTSCTTEVQSIAPSSCPLSEQPDHLEEDAYGARRRAQEHVGEKAPVHSTSGESTPAKKPSAGKSADEKGRVVVADIRRGNPATRPKAAPQTPSSNMPMATAAAGRKNMLTPKSGRLGEYGVLGQQAQEHIQQVQQRAAQLFPVYEVPEHGKASA